MVCVGRIDGDGTKIDTLTLDFCAYEHVVRAGLYCMTCTVFFLSFSLFSDTESKESKGWNRGACYVYMYMIVFVFVSQLVILGCSEELGVYLGVMVHSRVRTCKCIV